MATHPAKKPINGVEQSVHTLLTELTASGSTEAVFQSLCMVAMKAAEALGAAVLAKGNGQVAVVASTVQGHGDGTWLSELKASYATILADNEQVAVLSVRPVLRHGVFVPLGEDDGYTLSLAVCLEGVRNGAVGSAITILQLTKSLLLAAHGHSASQDPSQAQSVPPASVPANTVSTKDIADRPGASADKDIAASSAMVHSTQEQGSGSVSLDVAGVAPGHRQTHLGASDSTLAKVIQVLGEVHSQPTFFAACVSLCGELSVAFSCSSVAIGRVRGKNVQVVALDQMETFSRHTEDVRQIEEAMLECLEQNNIIVFPHTGSSGGGITITRAAGELSRSHGGQHVFCLPMHHEEQVGAVLLVLVNENESSAEFLAGLTLVAELAATRLADLRAAELPLGSRVLRSAKMFSTGLFGKHHAVLKLGSVIVGCFLLLSLLVRGDLIITAPCIIEGVNSYTHTASMDGYLSEVLAKPGDFLKQGDLLGRLDSTEILLEIAAHEAQLAIYRDQGYLFMQEGKDAEAAIAELEMAKAKADLEWAKARLSMTELRSSVDGFLVSEDMTPRLRQPVRRGQDLFEVTDTKSLRISMHVEEMDISAIITAMAGRTVGGEFSMTAYPQVSISFDIERVHPFATVVSGVNGFQIWGQILNTPDDFFLRPGMEGYAKIHAGTRPLLFLWTKKIADKLSLLWWEWF